VEEKKTARIADKKTRDGISITFYDRSREIVGDRWQVELTGEVEIPVSETFWAAVSENDGDLLDCVRKKIGNQIHFSVSRIRNFVDQAEKQPLLDEMVRRFEENIMHYLDSPNFTQKLFVKYFNEAREKCLFEGYRTPEPDQPEDEDQGPADFSRLFK
jgi:hypothetical protein